MTLPTLPPDDPGQTLPIDAVLSEVIKALRESGMVVVQAPPGAGKTTRVPLALMQSGLVTGRILMLEPRRLAARAAAERMAQTLGEGVGARIGYRMRGETNVGPNTVIEVVTEGILTRMIQSDPQLSGVGAVIFDEFHERSLNADLGLALTLELRAALRDELLVVVMSATLDAEPVARLMGGAPMVTSTGRAYEVETHYLSKPLPPTCRFEAALSALIVEAYWVSAHLGGTILVFLPGEGEIHRAAAQLAAFNLTDVTIAPLFGAMTFGAQRQAIAPIAQGRKIVLATSIAETSLTIPDVRVVVDGGRARRARFDPNSGMARLVTEKVTRAEATQRKGRAGRVSAGLYFPLWTRGEEGALAAFPPAEIEAADLTGLALELALWGGSDEMAFLTPPPSGALAMARSLLCDLGVLEKSPTGFRLTPHGRALAGLPLHPRLAHMVIMAGGSDLACLIATLLAERDPLPTAPPDLLLRIKAVQSPQSFQRDHSYDIARPLLARIQDEAGRLRKIFAKSMRKAEFSDLTAAQLVALAYPDRVGLRRAGDAPRWILSGGKGALALVGQPLSRARLLVATDLDGDRREAKIRQAVQISEAELRALYASQIVWKDMCIWSRREGRILARSQERFGALVLGDRPWTQATPQDLAKAAFEGLQLIGLTWSAPAQRLAARVRHCADGVLLPNLSEVALLVDGGWILPFLDKVRTESDLRALDLTPALKALLGYEAMALIDRLAPPHFETPLGRRVPIDYNDDLPAIEVKLQEMFGLATHPCTGPNKAPIRITLLSPASAPLQVTRDLPQFWASSYADVRRDMRGRYPRHPWPEDPLAATPTTRAKPRGT